MAEKLNFNLVSPERELVSREVDQVIVPGAEGEMGVLPNHAPVMSTLMPGVLVVKEGSQETQIFVRGGFADVTPAGLTVLAEQAIPVDELTGDVLAAERQSAEAELQGAESAEAIMAAERAVAVLSAF